MNRFNKRGDSRSPNDQTAKKRKVDADSSNNRGRTMSTMEDEVKILFSGSKEDLRAESAEERLKKAMEKIESLKNQMNGMKEKEVDLSRRLGEYELLSRVKVETAEELYDKSSELAKTKKMFDGACKEARMAQLRAEEAEKKLEKLASAAPKPSTLNDVDYIRKNIEQAQRINSLVRELDRLKQMVESGRKIENEMHQTCSKLDEMRKENELLKERVMQVDIISAQVHALRGESMVLERKFQEEKDERISQECMVTHTKQYLAHLEEENKKMEEEMKRLEDENSLLRRTDSGSVHVELEKEKARNERLERMLRNNNCDDEIVELKQRNTNLLHNIVQMQNNQRTIEQNMHALSVAFDHSVKERNRLETQKKSLKDRITWFEENWPKNSKLFMKAEWNAAAEHLRPLPPPPPPPFFHPNPNPNSFPKPTAPPPPPLMKINLRPPVFHANSAESVVTAGQASSPSVSLVNQGSSHRSVPSVCTVSMTSLTGGDSTPSRSIEPTRSTSTSMLKREVP